MALRVLFGASMVAVAERGSQSLAPLQEHHLWLTRPFERHTETTTQVLHGFLMELVLLSQECGAMGSRFVFERFIHSDLKVLLLIPALVRVQLCLVKSLIFLRQINSRL